jgi:aminopeptidase N
VVNGIGTSYRQDKRVLWVKVPQTSTKKQFSVTISYHSINQNGGGFGWGGGWHWVSSKTDKNRIGFWTQGEAEFNSAWVPTWDYPNDFATTETITTVPADWTLIGNGALVGTKVVDGGKRKTWTWKMSQPHATYLLSLAGGLMDVKKDKWRGVDLWYCVPKGRGNLISGSFGDTPDMLSFFSDLVGVKYPWPKYAQVAVPEFGGGMENVSASTLDSGALTNNKNGRRDMASLNSHELSHQWFGDYVTCRDWSDTWLNEGFATLFEALYMEHSRGTDAYNNEIRGFKQGYFSESRYRKHALSTRNYTDPDATFDGHAYSKGGVILHMLRRQLGDKLFFGGVKLYLERNAYKPVQSSDLCRALSDYSGINLEPFFDQWVYKPGHPIIEQSWTFDDATSEVVLTLKQVQKTDDGTPIYSFNLPIALEVDGKQIPLEVGLSKQEETYRLKANKNPTNVILDPKGNWLVEVKK